MRAWHFAKNMSASEIQPNGRGLKYQTDFSRLKRVIALRDGSWRGAWAWHPGFRLRPRCCPGLSHPRQASEAPPREPGAILHAIRGFIKRIPAGPACNA